MLQEFSTAFSLQRLIENARANHRNIYDKWCEVGTKLAYERNDNFGHAREHLDANFDLILRDLEREQALAIERYGTKFDGGILFLQISLSKMWLFSVYEVIRETCEVPCASRTHNSTYCNQANCFRCNSLKPVRDRLNAFRIPLAKLRPERTRNQKNVHAEVVIDDEAGSIGWRTYSGRTQAQEISSRLVLSHFTLDTLL
ncbi:hypothetical protein [Ruegeria sp. 6PALISEP08]|uniref:hypothetical protein n=1 Tax=Ruegeria sp. 6PALISEP08 TaxID=1225660 RepID=UPI000B2C2219|nr:hypothetical protein [Ruegeria sp. 6PALISEP08]